MRQNLLFQIIFIFYFQLIKQLPDLGAKNKAIALCDSYDGSYSIKARALIHAHLSRIPLNPNTLEKDKQYIVKKCPYLIQEMVTCANRVILLAYARRGTYVYYINYKFFFFFLNKIF